MLLVEGADLCLDKMAGHKLPYLISYLLSLEQLEYLICKPIKGMKSAQVLQNTGNDGME